MKKRLALLAILALAFTSPLMAEEQSAQPHGEADRTVEIEGFSLPAEVEIGEKTLGLNGTGIRRAFFRDYYLGALYLPEPMSSTAEIISRHGPSRISLNFIRDVSLSRMQSALEDGFEDNTPASEREALAEEIETFKDFFEPPQEGDRIDIDYDPERGTIVSINGEEKGVVEGAEFNLAVLRIFLGENPADTDLRDGMLGMD
ncbi:hypothetical protein J2T60_002597 [Natronospira proteinivora]|uniref:Chalcone isomerase domain-containing protein n=1 Tax=Natronospira proteinivora TaxID=1807133 RepID=A0ABT1GE02_9GAMM|nr:chalcone isomerase family protein [Natronospira proteinivora]MCP1728583.1 hypothetical protein [Natronospira proteinivora]